MLLIHKKNHARHNHQPDGGPCNLAFALLVIMLVLSGSLFSCFADTVEETMQHLVLINPYPLGDTRNSASVPYAVQMKGEILWRAETTQKTNPQPARQLAIKDEFLMAGYGPYIGLHQRDSGKVVWSWQVGANFKFHLTPDGLVTLDYAGFYRILHFDKSFGEPLSLPFLDDQTVLYYIAQTGDEYRYGFALTPQPTSSPDDMVVGPEISYYRYNAKSREFYWEFNQESDLLDLLYDDSANRVWAVGSHMVFVFPADAKDDKEVASTPFQRVLGAALNAEGGLVIVAKIVGKQTFSLMALGKDFKPAWSHDLGPSPTLLQPPCPMPDQSVSLLMGKELVNISGGKRNWAVTIPGYTDQAHLTVLKDGDILVAAGPILTQFTSKGQKRNSAIIEEPITCRPIVDEKGRIYMAGIKGIYCLK